MRELRAGKEMNMYYQIKLWSGAGALLNAPVLVEADDLEEAFVLASIKDPHAFYKNVNDLISDEIEDLDKDDQYLYLDRSAQGKSNIYLFIAESRVRRLEPCAPCDAQIGRLILYKGLLFDNWNSDECGTWITLCQYHSQQHKDLLSSEMRPEGSGCCDLDGCDETDGEGKTECHYVDLDPKQIVYLKEVK